VPPQPSGVPQKVQLGVHPHWLAVPPPPQVCGEVQLPQFSVPPQPSPIIPQLSGKGQAVSLVQPQTLGVPGFPPPQVWPAGQVGPQLSIGQPASGGVYIPQLSPAGQDAGHWLTHIVWSALHAELVGHGPQLTVPPQPSGIVPQMSPAGHAAIGVHPHTFGLLGVPPPQVLLPEHVPQLSMPPQPSAIIPQLSGEGQAVSLVQPQTLGVPGFPPPQV
jgi:hypothetical protein